MFSPHPVNTQAKVFDLGAVLTEKLKVTEGELRATQAELATTKQEVALKTKDLQEVDKEKAKLKVCRKINLLVEFFSEMLHSFRRCCTL